MMKRNMDNGSSADRDVLLLLLVEFHVILAVNAPLLDCFPLPLLPRNCKYMEI